MPRLPLKLKQASVVLGVTPKQLQNLVQMGVLHPRRREDVFWFDANLLMQAKIAFYVKDSIRPATAYLSELTTQLSRVDLATVKWNDLLLRCGPGRGKSSLEIRIPLRELREELDASMPLADVAPDLPRGRKRQGWKQEFVSTLQQAGKDMKGVSERHIVNEVRAYRSEGKKRPEIRLVTPAKKTA